MNNILFEKVNELKTSIENDNRVLLLNKIEKEVETNEEIMVLSYKKDMALTKYEDAVKYCGENSIEASNARKILADAKYNLDIHPLVQEYNKAYKEVRILYEQINKELFYIFRTHRCEEKRWLELLVEHFAQGSLIRLM